MADIDNEKILIEEVKIVQDIIKRMANNSFSAKTWTITMIVAALLLKGNNNHIYISFIPLFSFWFLDAYYLQQERLYRKIHNWVSKNRLNTNSNLFNMDTSKYKGNEQSVIRIMFSISILPFYGGILIILCVYLTLIHFDYIINFIEHFKLYIEGLTHGK